MLGQRAFPQSNLVSRNAVDFLDSFEFYWQFSLTDNDSVTLELDWVDFVLVNQKSTLFCCLEKVFSHLVPNPSTVMKGKPDSTTKLSRMSDYSSDGFHGQELFGSIFSAPVEDLSTFILRRTSSTSCRPLQLETRGH